MATALAIGAAAWAGLTAGVFDGFRRQATDALFPSGALDPAITIVGVDRQSILETAKPWPWPRQTQADLVRAIAAHGARLQVVDVVYHPATDQDPELVDSLRASGNVIVASTGVLTLRPGQLLFRSDAPTRPVAPIAAVTTTGHANITPDAADGVVRNLPLAVEDSEGNLIPSLALAALGRLDGYTGPLTVRPRGVQIGQRFIPTGPRTLLQVNYAAALQPGASGAPYVSAVDVLEGRLPAGALRDRVVLVGVADSALGDQHITPTNREGGMPGVFVHANALNTMLTGSYLTPASRSENVFWVVSLSLIAALAALRLPVWASIPVAVGTSAAYVLFGFARFDAGGVVDLVYPNLAIALAFVASLAIRFTNEARQRGRLATVLGQYVPPPVARHLLEEGRRGELPTGMVTFLFTDVVGSTAAWESHPQAMARAMRRQDLLIDRAVEASGGAVVRPRGEGDSRFAVFIRPIDAIRAASMIARTFSDEPWPTPEPIRVRTAVHTGEADLRAGDYYGSPVNRCARIRSVAEPGQVLVSAKTAALVAGQLSDGVALRPIGTVQLKDLTEPEDLFELCVSEGTREPSDDAWESLWTEPPPA